MYASAKRAHLWNCHFTVKKILFIIDRWPPFYILAPLPYQPLACPQAVPSMCVCRVFLSQLFQKQQLCVQQSRAASHCFEQKVAPSLTRVVPYRQPTRSCGQCSHSHSHKHIWTKNWQKENQNTIDWLIPENGDLFSDQKIPSCDLYNLLIWRGRWRAVPPTHMRPPLDNSTTFYPTYISTNNSSWQQTKKYIKPTKSLPL